MDRALIFFLYCVGILLVVPAAVHLIPFKDWGLQGFDGPFAWRRYGWMYVSDFAVNILVGGLCILAALKYEQINLYIPSIKPVLRLIIFICGILLIIFSIGLIWAIIDDIISSTGITKDLLIPTIGILSGAFTKFGIGLLTMFIAKKIGVTHDPTS